MTVELRRLNARPMRTRPTVYGIRRRRASTATAEAISKRRTVISSIVIMSIPVIDERVLCPSNEITHKMSNKSLSRGFVLKINSTRMQELPATSLALYFQQIFREGNPSLPLRQKMQPFTIFGKLNHGRTVPLGDLFNIQHEALLFIADQFHGRIDIFQNALSETRLQLADHSLDDGKGHFAQRLQWLVMMD